MYPALRSLRTCTKLEQQRTLNKRPTGAQGASRDQTRGQATRAWRFPGMEWQGGSGLPTQLSPRVSHTVFQGVRTVPPLVLSPHVPSADMHQVRNGYGVHICLLTLFLQYSFASFGHHSRRKSTQSKKSFAWPLGLPFPQESKSFLPAGTLTI